MITNEQKNEFLETIFERILVDAQSEDAQKEIMSLLMGDTNNGKMYKYRAINEYSLENLREGTLYCALPSSFNDPFDCKLGFDVQSLLMALYGKELKTFPIYLEKFGQILKGKMAICDCEENEKELFGFWSSSEKIRTFVEKCAKGDFDLYSDEEIYVEATEVIIEMLVPLLMGCEFKDQLESISRDFGTALRNMSLGQQAQVLDENASLADRAKSIGIRDDADEISLARLVIEQMFPNHAEAAYEFDEKLSEVNQQLEETIDSHFRVGSLCTDYKNKLMWSHYAEGHKGFCIEYDFSEIEDMENQILILPVVYSNERIKFPWEAAVPANRENDEIKREATKRIVQSLLTKDEVWSYENEWRIIINNDSGIKNIKMPPISCIYVGALCDLENKKNLIEIANILNVPIKQMDVDRGEYTLHATAYMQ